MTTEPKVTPRGFRYFDPVLSSYPNALTDEVVHGPENVRVYESSAAAGPYLWLAVKDPEDPRPGRATAHLGLDDAKELRDQIDWFLTHHYQLPEAPNP